MQRRQIAAGAAAAWFLEAWARRDEGQVTPYAGHRPRNRV